MAHTMISKAIDEANKRFAPINWQPTPAAVDYAKAVAKLAVEMERNRIVAWLRDKPGMKQVRFVQAIANEIEADEHKPPVPPDCFGYRK